MAGLRTYGTDALGSVIATYDNTGKTENTYRYKPCGGLLAKTGTTADPLFTWAGSLGYRQTGRGYSDLYVRARHYSAGLGVWTTVDPLWPGSAPYGYSQGSPVGFSDPSGLDLSTGAVGCPSKSPCQRVLSGSVIHGGPASYLNYGKSKIVACGICDSSDDSCHCRCPRQIASTWYPPHCWDHHWVLFPPYRMAVHSDSGWKCGDKWDVCNASTGVTITVQVVEYGLLSDVHSKRAPWRIVDLEHDAYLSLGFSTRLGIGDVCIGHYRPYKCEPQIKKSSGGAGH